MMCVANFFHLTTGDSLNSKLKKSDFIAYIYNINSACNKYIKKEIFLTHWGRDNMDTISQTTFSSAFSWMKML